MLKIYNYDERKYIKEEEIKSNMILRLTGDIQEINQLLEKVKFEEVKKIMENSIVIKVLPCEFKTVEKMTNKDFKKEFNRILRNHELDEVEAFANICHDMNGVYGEIGYYYNDEYITVCYVNDDSLSDNLDNEENLTEVKKAMKKAYTKYKKWFSNFNIELEPVKEVTC